MNASKHAAVLGSPIGHSLSPVLHTAGYESVGLSHWQYHRQECTEDHLPATLAQAGEDYVGFSVTMPCKHAAFQHADELTDRAKRIGSVNTLYRSDAGWVGDCTDAIGVDAALAALSIPSPEVAVVLGAGGTVHPIVDSLARAGYRTVIFLTRNLTSSAVEHQAKLAGMHVYATTLSDASAADILASADVVISALPVQGAIALAGKLDGVKAFFDVLYHPWPTELGGYVQSLGAPVVAGDVMLLHQAAEQVRIFTGQQPDVDHMAAALAAHLHT